MSKNWLAGKTSKLAVAGAFVLSLVAISNAQAQDPAQWVAVAASKSVAVGASTTVKLVGKFEDGWYIYSVTQGKGGPIPTRVTLPDSTLVRLGGKITSKKEPVAKFDENFGIEIEKYDEGVELEVPVKILPSVKPGAKEVTVAVRYQACNDTVCLPPRTKRVKVPLTITAKGK